MAKTEPKPGEPRFSQDELRRSLEKANADSAGGAQQQGGAAEPEDPPAKTQGEANVKAEPVMTDLVKSGQKASAPAEPGRLVDPELGSLQSHKRLKSIEANLHEMAVYLPGLNKAAEDPAIAALIATLPAAQRAVRASIAAIETRRD